MASLLRGLVSRALKKVSQGKETSARQGVPGALHQQSWFERDRGGRGERRLEP